MNLKKLKAYFKEDFKYDISDFLIYIFIPVAITWILMFIAFLVSLSFFLDYHIVVSPN